MKILSSRRFALWWQLAMDWFQRQFAAIAASIDFTPVEEKLDEVKSDVADVKTAVENIDFTPLEEKLDTTVAQETTSQEIKTQMQNMSEAIDVALEDYGEQLADIVGLEEVDTSDSEQAGNTNEETTEE